ncbi:septation protein IspZ [Psychrobacter sp. HD31]|uniref:septation protein IspZ n=1 Tax=Psychrobacter sp. HD31 TaxID=3112003 RepID=UPI003DA5D2EA
MKQFLDFIPLIAFFIGVKQYGVIAGAGALLVATVVVYAIHFFSQDKKLDKQQWIVLILTIVFCGITILFNDEYFIKIKSPIINGVFALALAGSVLINKPLMQMALKQAFTLTDSGWKKLTLAWAGFFAMMAGVHYYTAFHMSQDAWISFKTYGWIPFMLVFMIAQFAVLRKHINHTIVDKNKN